MGQTRDPRGSAAPVVRVSVRAKPRASWSKIVKAQSLTIEVALAAPPVDGAANAALIELVASALGVAKSAVRLVLGETSKHKVLEVTGLAADEVAARLLEA